jgi:hypothetical protein
LGSPPAKLPTPGKRLLDSCPVIRLLQKLVDKFSGINKSV